MPTKKPNKLCPPPQKSPNQQSTGHRCNRQARVKTCMEMTLKNPRRKPQNKKSSRKRLVFCGLLFRFDLLPLHHTRLKKKKKKSEPKLTMKWEFPDCHLFTYSRLWYHVLKKNPPCTRHCKSTPVFQLEAQSLMLRLLCILLTIADRSIPHIITCLYPAVLSQFY